MEQIAEKNLQLTEACLGLKKSLDRLEAQFENKLKDRDTNIAKLKREADQKRQNEDLDSEMRELNEIES